jgi:hypothetical protein
MRVHHVPPIELRPCAGRPSRRGCEKTLVHTVSVYHPSLNARTDDQEDSNEGAPTLLDMPVYNGTMTPYSLTRHGPRRASTNRGQKAATTKTKPKMILCISNISNSSRKRQRGELFIGTNVRSYTLLIMFLRYCLFISSKRLQTAEELKRVRRR